MEKKDIAAVGGDQETPLSPDVAFDGDAEKLDAARAAAAPGRDEVKRAAAGEKLDDAEQEDALDWLLGAFDTGAGVQHRLIVNVGTPTKPKKVPWLIKSLPGPLIRKVREDAEDAVRRRRGGLTGGQGATDAGFEANLRVVVEGTLDPNILEAAKAKGVVDPRVFLEMALNEKQGLIDQIAGAILTLSGYDENDVADAVETRAAGNS